MGKKRRDKKERKKGSIVRGVRRADEDNGSRFDMGRLHKPAPPGRAAPPAARRGADPPQRCRSLEGSFSAGSTATIATK